MKSISTTSPAQTLLSQDTKQQGKKRIRNRNLRTALMFWSFVGPLVLGLTVFTYIPIIWGIMLSFFEARATVFPTKFVGLNNYLLMLGDKAFTDSLLTFTIFALFIIPTTFIFSLFLALLVNSVRRGQGFFRSVFFIPTACSYVVAALVWKMSIFNGLPYGLANAIRGLFGLEPFAWVATADPPYYWIVLVTVRLWLQVGFYMLLFIAGLQDIPKELYEAAYVDGAKKGWTTFFYITLPQLKNTSIAILILNLIAAFQAFEEFYNIMGSFVGSSGNAILARPPLVYLFGLAISGQDYGRGSAGAIIISLIIILFTLIQGRFLGFGNSSR